MTVLKEKLPTLTANAFGDMTHFPRRTKIVATLGPASKEVDMIDKLVQAGLNVVRINCSHGTHESHAEAIENVRTVAEKRGVYIPILLDLSGPKMRIRRFKNAQVILRGGDPFVLTTEDILGDHTRVGINYPALVEDIQPGDRVLMGDGEIELLVIAKTDTDIVCEVVVGGVLKSNKGLNAPGAALSEAVPTEKDLADVDFGIRMGVDWFAQSFVRYPEEIRRLKEYIAEKGADIPVVTKLERLEALDNLDEMLQASDAVMVARGDLGLEAPVEQVPLMQKEIIKGALKWARPVITATQMLESMIVNPRPTRAEVADIANAVFDGTDAVMLSAETASGDHPEAAVTTMAEVAVATEGQIDYLRAFDVPWKMETIRAAIAHAAVHTATEIGAKLIICCTRTGQTARLVAKYRPHAKIVVASPRQTTLRRTVLYWNTAPMMIEIAEDTDSMLDTAVNAVVKAGYAAPGDRVVVVAGIPIDVPGTTNMIKAVEI